MEEAIPYTRSDHVEEEDCIDMEVLPSDSAIFSSSSHPAIDFEFQMLSITSSERYTPSTSPADELFCKGKLLPLHLPPRLQMLRKLLENTNTFSPFNSCHVSTEPIRPDTEEGINEEASKGGSFSSKVKASRAYFKSLFSKSSSALTGKSLEKGDNGSGYEESGRRRRSFSGASKRLLSPTKVSSQRFSITSDDSNGYPEKPLFRRSSSGRYSWDREDSIQEAIDYCKRSQH
ncbi:unnamed protein product [Cuscuta epithymum]|uniref:Membrane-associated kinase regulator 4 n=1 Tax=Cuscuta epithymum TaxID=186058 RepID=A0AAV0FDP3_9ASTE|nr:unnamed protein product [Cuscuta epithymum]